MSQVAVGSLRDDRLLARVASGLFIALVAANVVAFALECGLGQCPDNPTDYLWWPGSK